MTTPLDALATAVAKEHLCDCCHPDVVADLTDEVATAATRAIEAKATLHTAHFAALTKSLEKHEKRYVKMLRAVWKEEERIILANLKKLKKAWRQKDKVDSVLYPKTQFTEQIADDATSLLIGILDDESSRIIDQYSFDIDFDIDDPKVQKWLKAYPVKFAKDLEKVSFAKLKKLLTEMLDEGVGIDEMTRRIRKQFTDWSKHRAEMVSRTEVMRGSNRAALETYRQSGVVERKIWITHFGPRTCGFCEDLDGQTISLETNYYEEGDVIERTNDEGKTERLTLDYSDTPAPPLHPMCRCSIAAMID